MNLTQCVKSCIKFFYDGYFKMFEKMAKLFPKMQKLQLVQGVVFLLLLWPVCLCSQQARILVNTQGEQNPWSHLRVNNAPATFQFAIVTDRTGGHRPGVFPTAIEKLNLLQPEFVMSVGDLIEGYTEDEARIDQEWEEFTGFISGLQAPFFYVPGNHDYINEVMARKWKERFGRDYYHFVYKEVLFLCLNSEERMRGSGKGYIDEPQLAYIRQVLEEHPGVKWTLVFLHQPLWDQEDPGLWPEVERLLQGRKHTVFAGHRHRYVKYSRNASNYFILATTGGGSSLRGSAFGEFDHVVWVSMTDEGPIIANLLLDGIWDQNVNTEARYALTRPLMNKEPLLIEGLLEGEAIFSGRAARLRITNDSEVPMKVFVEAVSNEDLWAAFAPFERSLPPNSVELVDLPLRSKEDVIIPLEEMQPVQLKARVVYLPPEQAELEMNFSYLLKPQPIYDISRAAGAVQIDGRLTDWPQLSQRIEEAEFVQASPFAYQGSQDASFAFDVQYDDTFLYLAAEVWDDQLELDEHKNALEQDGLAFILDPTPAAATSAANWRNALVVGLSAAKGGSVQGHGRLPEGTKWACKTTEGGYIAEVAIPLTYLDERYGGSWQRFRLNVIVRDFDMEGMHESTLFWQPDWRGKENQPGAGVFEKR
ncbi:MAG: hypothetical protein D6730_25245 [Bacteroidetes bacterium]|nr:MAG: hypothetical protein D6730_25245 [Bacteroidota bacterium]